MTSIPRQRPNTRRVTITSSHEASAGEQLDVYDVDGLVLDYHGRPVWLDADAEAELLRFLEARAFARIRSNPVR